MLQPRNVWPMCAAVTLAFVLTLPATADIIKLSTGETLNVKILEQTEKTIRFVHPVLGEITLPRESVEILPAAPEPKANAPAVAPSEAKPQPPAATPAPAPAPPPPEEQKEWKFKLVLAAAATEGNSQNASFSTIFTATRENERMKTVIDASYFFASSDSITSENRFSTGILQNWLNPGSRWFYFADARYDHDQFQSWDNRVQGHGGIGYHLIQPPKLRLDLLAGLGAVKEWGSDNTDVRPEGLLGVDGEYTFAQKHSIKFNSTYYPDLSNIGEFRWTNSIAWAWTVDEKHDLSLTAGVQHEYQSNVDPGRKYNDVRAYAGLQIGF